MEEIKTNATMEEQDLSEILKISSFVCFWLFLILSIVCLYFAIRNSFGNIAEIINLLDKKNCTGEELQANYQYLIEKYGEWVIGTGGSGWTISFINIGRALFSGIMIMNCIFFVVCLTLSILSKWLLPKIAERIKDSSQDTVNIEVLKMVDNNNKKEN